MVYLEYRLPNPWNEDSEGQQMFLAPSNLQL